MQGSHCLLAEFVCVCCNHNNVERVPRASCICIICHGGHIISDPIRLPCNQLAVVARLFQLCIRHALCIRRNPFQFFELFTAHVRQLFNDRRCNCFGLEDTPCVCGRENVHDCERAGIRAEFSLNRHAVLAARQNEVHADLIPVGHDVIARKVLVTQKKRARYVRTNQTNTKAVEFRSRKFRYRFSEQSNQIELQKRLRFVRFVFSIQRFHFSYLFLDC